MLWWDLAVCSDVERVASPATFLRQISLPESKKQKMKSEQRDNRMGIR